jgi:SAM-dependent methyltransferase
LSEHTHQQSCDICGLDYPGKLYAQGRSYSVLRCVRCGLIWTDPLFTEVSSDTVSFGMGMPYYAEAVYKHEAPRQKDRFRRQLRWISDVLARDGHSGLSGARALEVGTGLGFFLDVCRELEIRAEGCDINETAVRYAMQTGHDVRLGTLDSSYDDEAYDLVVALNLIEHLPHPGAFFQEAGRVIRSGGCLVLETPIQESFFHRSGLLANRFFGRSPRLLGLNPGGHCYKFSKRTFRTVCDEFGFRLLALRNVASPYHELMGKLARLRHIYSGLFRSAVAVMWGAAAVTRQGNRCLVVLQKP